MAASLGWLMTHAQAEARQPPLGTCEAILCPWCVLQVPHNDPPAALQRCMELKNGLEGCKDLHKILAFRQVCLWIVSLVPDPGFARHGLVPTHTSCRPIGIRHPQEVEDDLRSFLHEWLEEHGSSDPTERQRRIRVASRQVQGSPYNWNAHEALKGWQPKQGEVDKVDQWCSPAKQTSAGRAGSQTTSNRKGKVVWTKAENLAWERSKNPTWWKVEEGVEVDPETVQFDCRVSKKGGWLPYGVLENAAIIAGYRKNMELITLHIHGAVHDVDLEDMTQVSRDYGNKRSIRAVLKQYSS